MKFWLGKNEPACEGISRINRALSDRARELIATGDNRTDSAVFELRKTVKKLRAILRITRPALGNKSYRVLDRLMRDFARRLGPLRDSAVLIDTLDALLEHFKPYPDDTALRPARDALHCRYRLALEEFMQRNDEQTLAAAFSAIGHRLCGLDLEGFSRPVLLSGIEQTYRRCRAGLQNLHDEPSTRNSHDLRRQVKYAWNQLRLLRKDRAGSFRPVIADLDRLGSLLGEDSDIAMLVEALQRHPEICCNRVRTEFITALAETRRVALLGAGLHLADGLFAATPEDFGSWLRRGTGDRRA